MSATRRTLFLPPLGMLVVGQAAAALLVSSVTGRVRCGPNLALGYVPGVIGAIYVIFAAARTLTCDSAAAEREPA